MSEEEEVLWETSARHLCFRCFSQILTHFSADLLGYSKQTFPIHTAGALLFKQDLEPQSVYCHFDKLRLPQARRTEKTLQRFHVLLNKEMTKRV